MRKVKLNGEVRYVVDRWDELRLRHLIGLETIDTSSLTDVFSVLSGIPIMIVDNSRGIEEAIYDVVKFIYENPPNWKSLKAPKHFIIAGKPYKVPNPSKCLTGQNLMLDRLMEKPLLEIVPEALAIYFQPLIDGKFDRARIPAVMEMILDTTAIDAFATVNFFLHSGKNLERIMEAGSLRLKRTPSQT
jgi:hypothetical protein